MTLAVTDEHLQLAESVRALAARLCPPGFARAAADSADAGTASYRDALAPGLAEQGLLGLHVPEADGGQGFGLPELTVAIEDLGRALVPGGFVPTVLASAVLIAGGLTGKLVGSLADGSATAAVALTAELDAEPGTDDALVVSGSASLCSARRTRTWSSCRCGRRRTRSGSPSTRPTSRSPRSTASTSPGSSPASRRTPSSCR